MAISRKQHIACLLRAPISGTYWEELKDRYLMIIPKVVAHNFQRFLEISSPLISNIVAVGTTSDNVSSKRKTLDEVSLSSSKSVT